MNNSKPKVRKTCRVCGRQFDGMAGKKYCSPECRRKEWEERRKGVSS